MSADTISRLHPRFEEMVHVQEGIEFYYARDLQVLLGYSEWRNFLSDIEKAREACRSSKDPELDHFVDVNKMVPLGWFEATDRGYQCSRYACANNRTGIKERRDSLCPELFCCSGRNRNIEEHIRLSERLHAERNSPNQRQSVQKPV